MQKCLDQHRREYKKNNYHKGGKARKTITARNTITAVTPMYPPLKYRGQNVPAANKPEPPGMAARAASIFLP